MLEQITIKEDILTKSAYQYVFSVEKVNELVKQGQPFREAYRSVGKEIENKSFEFMGDLNHTHQGSIGNLMNNAIKEEFYAKLGRF